MHDAGWFPGAACFFTRFDTNCFEAKYREGGGIRTKAAPLQTLGKYAPYQRANQIDDEGDY